MWDWYVNSERWTKCPGYGYEIETLTSAGTLAGRAACLTWRQDRAPCGVECEVSSTPQADRINAPGRNVEGARLFILRFSFPLLER